MYLIPLSFLIENRQSMTGKVSPLLAILPQLILDDKPWRLLDVDPYFTPTTAEEREEWGEQIHTQQRKNLARRYIDAVRSRKGQQVDTKVVMHAEKQRTRKTG